MIAVLILAAGQARRFGGNKLLAPLGSLSVLDHVVQAASDLDADRHAVIGPDDAGRAKIFRDAGYRLHVNQTPKAGQATSLAVGLAGIQAKGGYDGVLILLGDMPFIAPSTLSALISEDVPSLCCAGDVTSPPAFLPARLFAAAQALSGDRGAARLILADSAHRRIECPADQLRDIDHPSDLERVL